MQHLTSTPNAGETQYTDDFLALYEAERLAQDTQSATELPSWLDHDSELLPAITTASKQVGNVRCLYRQDGAA